jgi:hypothetical protein
MNNKTGLTKNEKNVLYSLNSNLKRTDDFEDSG